MALTSTCTPVPKFWFETYSASTLASSIQTRPLPENVESVFVEREGDMSASKRILSNGQQFVEAVGLRYALDLIDDLFQAYCHDDSVQKTYPFNVHGVEVDTSHVKKLWW